MSQDVKYDYLSLKEELLTAFSLNCYSSDDQLREEALHDGETVDAYLTLQNIVSSWFKTVIRIYRTD